MKNLSDVRKGWESMPAEDKAAYFDLAKMDRERFMIERKFYVKSRTAKYLGYLEDATDSGD